MHRGLASMYESDDRFRQSIDKHGEGLTHFSPRRFAQTQHAFRTEVCGRFDSCVIRSFLLALV